MWYNIHNLTIGVARLEFQANGTVIPPVLAHPNLGFCLYVYPIGTTIHSPQTGETLTFRSTRESSNGALFQAELLLQPGTYVSRSHIHPRQEERFVVLEGRFGWRIGNKTGIANPGETLVAPIGVPHHQWNAGDTPVRIYYEHRPALESCEVFFETQFGLSRERKLTSKGDFPLLQGAVLLEQVCDFIRPANPPVWLQKLAFPTVAKIGRMLGLRARYDRYRLPAQSGGLDS